MLAEEFLRANVDFDFYNRKRIDAQAIFHKMEPRNLSAAYKYYCGRNMSDDFEAHKADNDTEATYRVLLGQLEMYCPEQQSDATKHLSNNVNSLADMSIQGNYVDFSGRFVWRHIPNEDGKTVRVECFNFGKFKGQPVAEVLKREPGYYSWMMSGEFPATTKQILARIKAKQMAKELSNTNK